MEDNPGFRRRWLTAWLVFEGIALVAAILSSGGGHGDYLFAKLLFPVPMYLGVVHEVLDLPILILIVIQYPLVGLTPFLISWRRTMYVCALLGVIHAIFTFLVFTHPSTQFG